MFLGHFGVALASKPPAPPVSLGTLFLAAQFLDLLWPVFVLSGIETVRIVPGITRVTPLDFVSYPYSHSLAAAVFWSLMVGGIYGAVRRWARGAAVVGGLVFSHWVLDFITHRPDLAIAPGLSARVGLGLWNSLSGTLLAEATLFLGGCAIYLRVTQPRDRVGSYGTGALLLVLVGISLASTFGPPPPSTTAIAWSGLGMWLLVAWAYWVDRHRSARSPLGAQAVTPGSGPGPPRRPGREMSRSSRSLARGPAPAPAPWSP